MLDANAHVGSKRLLEEGDHEGVGPFGQDVESWSGGQMRAFLLEFRLACFNTWCSEAAGPTDWDGYGRYSRLDYIIAPKALLSNCARMTVKYRLATQIQRCMALHWVDHAPLELLLRYGPRIYQDQQQEPSHRWDWEKLRTVINDKQVDT
eukprot:1060240-Heterocapsa_arctica.AAC.1